MATESKPHIEPATNPTGPGDPQLAAIRDAFTGVVKSRRSVRIYDGTPVPPEVVAQCLDLAVLAPNSSNLQPWEFYWVRTPAKKAKLVEACLSQPAAKTAAELIVCVARTKSWPANSGLMLKYFDRIASQGIFVSANARRSYQEMGRILDPGFLGLRGLWLRLKYWLQGLSRPTPREPVSRADMRIWAVKSSSLACENLMLAFRAHGYDSCPMEGFDGVRVAKLLKLPRDAVINMVISAGKRAPNGVYGPQVRFDRSNVVFEV